MMTTLWLPLFQLITLLATPLFGYTVYGTKRYARSATYPNSPTWVPVQPMVRSQRYPLNYYEVYPYNPEDYYYGQDNYPLYYPRTSKYEVYQAVLPYYYQDRYLNPSYYDYNSDGSNLKEQLLHDAEIEEREERQPIGHEKLYENDDTSLNEGDDEENIDDVNAAFLQNLIMSHMYKDALENKNNNNKYNNYNRYPYYDYASGDDYGKWDDLNMPAASRNVYEQEDDDVKALKQLARPTPYKTNNEDIHWFKENNFRKQKEQNKNKYDEYLKSKRSNLNMGEMLVETTKSPEFVGKGVAKIEPVTATPSSVTAQTQGDAKKGQKEEVLMRPATPVRHIFSNPVLEMMTKNDNDRKRSPSVYDKIRHMLDVEKSLETKYGDESALRPSMKKRLFTSDDKLTQQLTVLKKSQ